MGLCLRTYWRRARTGEFRALVCEPRYRARKSEWDQASPTGSASRSTLCSFCPGVHRRLLRKRRWMIGRERMADSLAQTKQMSVAVFAFVGPDDTEALGHKLADNFQRALAKSAHSGRAEDRSQSLEILGQTCALSASVDDAHTASLARDASPPEPARATARAFYCARIVGTAPARNRVRTRSLSLWRATLNRTSWPGCSLAISDL
jgi:hypothetical protein